jgi:hypothetical protein
MAQDSLDSLNSMDFEAELKAIEKNQLIKEDKQMRNADAVTDVISDEVANSQSGILKEVDTNSDTDETIMMTKKEKERFRRIRSRPL